jgi:hypothetical protein
MKVLLVLILIALIALLALRKQAPKQASIGIYILVGLLAIILIPAMFRSCGPDGPVVIPGFHEVAGKLLGQRLVEDYPDGGTVVVLLDGTQAAPGETYSTTQEAQMKGLHAAFKDTAIVLEEMLIQPEGDSHMAMVAAGPPISHERFFELLEERSDAMAVISCLGVPPLAMEVESDRAPLYVLEAITDYEGRLFIEDGMIEGGVFTRPGGDWTQKPKMGMSDKEILAMRYILLTVDDLEPEAPSPE